MTSTQPQLASLKSGIADYNVLIDQTVKLLQQQQKDLSANIQNSSSPEVIHLDLELLNYTLNELKKRQDELKTAGSETNDVEQEIVELLKDKEALIQEIKDAFKA